MPEPMLSNIVVDLFIKGGPIMWPILLATLAAVAAVGERILWWARFNKRRDRARLGEVFAAVQQGDVALALKKCHGTDDPAVKVVEAGLAAYPGGVEEAMQIVATDEVENAAKFLPVMDTLITLAPLLGLLGTVTGIMNTAGQIGSFLYAARSSALMPTTRIMKVASNVSWSPASASRPSSSRTSRSP